MFNIDLPSIFRFIILCFFLLLFILGVIFAIWQQRAWKPPLSHGDRLRRSITVGFAAYLVCLSFLFLLELFSTSGQVNIPILEILTFQCIALPVFVIASFGSYVGFSTQDKIYLEGKKRIEKGNKK